jgi:putative flippase GtrA
MGRPLADLHAHVRQHGPELVKFGIVGGLGTIIDLGGAAVLHSAFHEGPLESKALSITAATIFTYLGSRFWTFRHRDNQPVHREATLFVALNMVGLVLAELVIAGTTYGLGLKGQLAYNAASFIGTGLGTVFRWYAYRKWVFIDSPRHPHPQPQPAFAGGAHPDFPHYAPWELDPAYLDPAYSGWRPREHPRPVRLHNQNPVIPNGHVVSPVLAAPTPAGYPAGYSVRPAPAGPVPAGPRAPGRHRKR